MQSIPCNHRQEEMRRLLATFAGKCTSEPDPPTNLIEEDLEESHTQASVFYVNDHVIHTC